MKCPSCNVEFKSYTAVSLHFRNKHGTSQQFREIMRLKFVEEKHGGTAPTCKCGCGQVPRYFDYDRGYMEYVRGHHSRVHNNWGHNEAALLKSQDKRREQIAVGEWQAWNKGQTKETDERVAGLGQRQSTNFTPVRRARRGEIMTRSWKTGSITSLTGSAHSQWRGGVSSVQALSRSYVFNVWTYPKLLVAKFTCQGCGSTQHLEVHHNKERFAEILQKARIELGDVTDDFASHQSYARWVADYHVQNDVSGIVLCEQCHQKEHVTA